MGGYPMDGMNFPVCTILSQWVLALQGVVDFARHLAWHTYIDTLMMRLPLRYKARLAHVQERIRTLHCMHVCACACCSCFTYWTLHVILNN